MTIKLVGSSSGSVSLQAPATTTGGANRTLTLPDINSTVDTTGRAGNILQVVQTVKTDTATISSANTNTFVDLTGMSVAITPSATSNKILVIVNLSVSMAAGSLHIRLLRGSTDIFQGDSGGGNKLSSSILHRTEGNNHYIESISRTFLDSPSTTSATTYKLQGTLGSTYNSTICINRTPGDGNYDYAGRVVSTMTAMEVAG